jgi:phage terminase large subunit-like protein
VALEQDAAGNIKITKSKSKQKVDGAIALAMAIGVAQDRGRVQHFTRRGRRS